MKLSLLFLSILLLFTSNASATPVMINTQDGVISIAIRYPPVMTLPCPCLKPSLRPYIISKEDDFWHAQDPSSYITPENEWIQYYAKSDIPFGIIYRTDESMYPDNPNKDVWQNADYTLLKGYGDCEDIAIVEVSIDIAKGKKAIVVGGYLTLDNGERIRDFWVESYQDGIKVVKGSNPLIQSQKNLRLEPEFMFNDIIKWSEYSERWYI